MALRAHTQSMLSDPNHRHLNYRSPAWLPGGQMQTIWPALFSRRFKRAAPQYRRERWDTHDGDFIDVDFSMHATREGTPLLVLFHGLEGSSRSHYSEAFTDWAREHQIACAIPHFRGCSGEINRAPRAYHCGDYEEIDWIVKRLKIAAPERDLIAVGVSLGGNALAHWAGRMGDEAGRWVRALSSVCSPLDMTPAGHHIGHGFNGLVYTPMFLRSMKPRALERLALHPKLFDRERLVASRNLYEFDDVFTAPLHGFSNVEDYWLRASAKPHLQGIRIPALIVNPINDPFVPASSLPRQSDVSPQVTLWQPRTGGHVGFPAGWPPGHVLALPQQVGTWLLAHR
jgi:uncharacterized protein